MKENDVTIMRYIHYQCYSELLYKWMDIVKCSEDEEKKGYSMFKRVNVIISGILALFVVRIRVSHAALGAKLLQ